MMDREYIRSVLEYDPIQEAEKLHGKDTVASKQAGLYNMICNNAKKDEMLDTLGDSKFINRIEDYIKIISNYGFEQIFKERFIRKDNRKDTLYAFWNDKLGIFLKFDTYNKNINSASFFYNVLFKMDLENRHTYTSTGSYYKRTVHDLYYYDKNGTSLKVRDKLGSTESSEKHNKMLNDNYYGLWIGDHDAREGVIYKIKGLEEAGKLFQQWIDPGYITLCVSDDEDRTKESLRRFALLPENIKQKICYDKIVKNHKKHE